jgi:hypothetical protein
MRCLGLEFSTAQNGAPCARDGYLHQSRSRLLSALLWQRLFRSQADGIEAAPVRHRRWVAFQQLETIYPQPFDMPIDLIVAEAGLQRRASQRD